VEFIHTVRYPNDQFASEEQVSFPKRQTEKRLSGDFGFDRLSYQIGRKFRRLQTIRAGRGVGADAARNAVAVGDAPKPKANRIFNDKLLNTSVGNLRLL
jgi:hypothetical protein